MWRSRRSEKWQIPSVRVVPASASFARLVRNVYKVLLTRGMSGTIIYSTDEQTRAALCASRRQLT